MKPAKPIVISASRRTDIPAFYMPWFMDRIKSGIFEVVNPFNRRVSHTSASPEHVHTIVFWSKNFRPFLDRKYGEALQAKGYNLFFNFTINSTDIRLEPNVPPLADRLHQLEEMCNRFGPQCLTWRFDPICVFNGGSGIERDNLGDFPRIAERAAANGIRRCITSFVDLYPKIRKRTASMPGFSFIDVPNARKVEILQDMKSCLQNTGICLSTCCEKDLLAHLPAETGIHGSSCIPNDLLARLYGGQISLKRDTGQRVRLGCGCRVSVDIGDYRRHPCFHNCLFCYANPARPPAGVDSCGEEKAAAK